MATSTKIVGVWFSYEKDTLALRQSVLEWNEQGIGEVVVFEDAAHPVMPAIRAIITARGGRFIPTDWPRNRGMRGWGVATNILRCLKQACELTGATHAFKIDSDTLVSLGPWFDPKAEVCGCDIGIALFPMGCCVSYRKEAVDTLLASVTAKDRQFGTGTGLPEDILTGIEALNLFPGKVKITKRGKKGGMAHFQYDKPQHKHLRDAAIVVFGNRCQIKGCDSDKREGQALAMAKWRKTKRKD